MGGREARYVRAKTGGVQHIIASEEARETFCARARWPQTRSGFRWDEATLSAERDQDLPLCKVCEKLGPHDEEDVRRFWDFSDIDESRVPDGSRI